MKAAMDAAGRVVIPKALRQALGFRPGQALEARATDGRLELEIAPTPMKLKKRGSAATVARSLRNERYGVKFEVL